MLTRSDVLAHTSQLRGAFALPIDLYAQLLWPVASRSLASAERARFLSARIRAPIATSNTHRPVSKRS